MQINMLEAKNRLSELVKSAQAGEEVIIANRGEPVARLIAVRNRDIRRGGTTRQSITAWLERHPLPAHAAGSAAEIDASIAAERDAWD